MNTAKRTSVVAFLVLLAACGGFSRQRALSDAMTGLNAGRDALIEWQKNCQEHAVEISPTEEAAKGAVQVCRTQRDKVVRLFVIAYNGLALAMVDPSNTSNYLEVLVDVKAVYDAVKGLQ